MSDKLLEKGKRVLEKAKSVLLVDWANPDVAFSLLKAGFTVFSYSPDGYSMAGLDIEERAPANGETNFEKKEKLIFRHMYKKKPASVDIVSVYRPDTEHASIITEHVLPLNAKILWLQPSVSSAKTRNIAFAHGFTFIDEIDIDEVARLINKDQENNSL